MNHLSIQNLFNSEFSTWPSVVSDHPEEYFCPLQRQNIPQDSTNIYFLEIYTHLRWTPVEPAPPYFQIPLQGVCRWWWWPTLADSRPRSQKMQYTSNATQGLGPGSSGPITWKCRVRHLDQLKSQEQNTVSHLNIKRC